ncbi:hypothetical protein SAMN05421868_104268 [Paenibacillus naphthalenovorans]|nr:hypothetical protein SAMN05421868_104268 [Paenibacillus naphthalenovorans]
MLLIGNNDSCIISIEDSYVKRVQAEMTGQGSAVIKPRRFCQGMENCCYRPKVSYLLLHYLKVRTSFFEKTDLQ